MRTIGFEPMHGVTTSPSWKIPDNYSGTFQGRSSTTELRPRITFVVLGISIAYLHLLFYI